MNKEYKPVTNLWKDSEGYRYFGTLKLSSKIKYDGDDFIQLWEWVNQLQQENKQLQKELEEYKNPIKYFKYASKNVTDENKKLKDNWNKLKEFIKDKYVYYEKETLDFFYGYKVGILGIRDKIQELEKGSDKK